MSEDATLGVMRLLSIWTPAGLVSEHVERENLKGLVDHIQILLERLCLQQALQNEVILDAFCICLLVQLLNLLIRSESEVHQVIRWLA